MERSIMCYVPHISLLLLLSAGFAASRRILHQPFFPLDSSPPSQPPSLPPAKIPFTGSGNGSPFFHGNPSQPSPPSPSAFASFPANISSLILPNSPRSNHVSQKLVAVSLAASLSAIVVIVVVFLYHRRNGCPGPHLNPGDKKIYGTDGGNSRGSNVGASSRIYSAILGTARNGSARKSRTHAANPEFLYLGTVADSHHVAVQDSSSCSSSELACTGILDSPELQPLPPLNRSRSFHDVNTVFVPDEDNDEFYSPRGSMAPATVSTPISVPIGGKGTPTNSELSSETSSPGSPAISDFHSMGPSSTLHPSAHLQSESRSTASPPLDLGTNVIDLGRRSISSTTGSSLDLESHKLTDSVELPRKMSEDLLASSSSDSENKTTIAEVDDIGVFEAVASSVSSSPSSSPDRLSHIPQNRPNPVVPSPPAPPPLPPPLSTPVKSLGNSPTFFTPKDKPIVSRPPPLIPPSRPFVIPNTGSNVSPMELPQADADDGDSTDEGLKPKLKPLHWDKVRASSDREMVWDHLRSSSFKLNEEMIESLFIVNTPAPPKAAGQTTPRLVIPKSNQEDRVLDPKRAQNIAILLRALNVTNEEVCEALLEGNADTLGAELLESLLKMAPSKEEERKLRDFKEASSTKLGQAEKFLKAVLDIPLAFKRVEAMLYVSNFESEISYLKKSFETLEQACEELRNSRLFLKLLETVLKTGNRMNVGTNRGDALAFKLDTLLMLVDVKGADGKTTLLHFVVQEIIRTEGAHICGADQSSSDDAKCRKLGLQVVSGLSSELAHVKKSATMDFDVLSSDVAKLSKGIQQVGDIVRICDGRKFSDSMNKFLKFADEEIIKLQAQESVALSLVKEITEYFHGNSAKEEAHPFRIFMVVRDFLTILDRVCREVGMINERTTVSSAHKFPVPVNPTLTGRNSDEENH